MMRTCHQLAFFPLLGLSALAPGPLPAQAQDPEAIQRIVRQVDEELQEIDKLLQQSARPGQSGRKPAELLQESRQRSEKVVEGIDELIKKLEEMRQQSQSSSPDEQQQQQGEGQGQQRRPPQTRREGETPEFQQQRQEQQGQQQEQGQQQPEPGRKQPTGEQDPRQPGTTRPGEKLPDDPTAPGKRGEGDQSWGELQPYVNFLKQRGSLPKVPEKFRKYWEAYLKNREERGR